MAEIMTNPMWGGPKLVDDKQRDNLGSLKSSKPKALRSKELQEQEINTKMEVARRLLQLSAKLRSQPLKAELTQIIALLMGVTPNA